MKILNLLLVLLSIRATLSQAAIVPDYNFDNGSVPSQWTTNPTGMLAIGTNHFVDGSKGAVWTVSANSTLNIWMGGQNTTTTPIIYLPVYSTVENNDTLRFSFYYSTSKSILLRQTDMILNYKGWREFHRHYFNDFGTNPGTGYFGYMEISYKPAAGSSRSEIWFDGAHLATAESGIYATRYPGPYFKTDYLKGYFNNVSNVNTDFLMPAMSAIPHTIITAAHRNSFSLVQNGFSYTALGGDVSATAAEIAAAKDTVKNYRIKINPDGSIKGNPIPRNNFTNTAVLQNYSITILNLANAALASTPDNAAKDSLIKFTRFLLDRGLAEGGPSTFPTNNYDFCRKYLWMGWTRAMPIYQAYDNANLGSTLAEDVRRWLRWAYQYGTIYRNNVDDVPGDYIYVASRILFGLANLKPTMDEQIRDYICGVDFYNKFSSPRLGGWESGIKIDGVYFHHGAMHNSYSYSLAQWINDMYKMNNTAFSISLPAYDNIAKAVNTELMQCATSSTANDGNAYFANSLCGRGPLSLSSRISATQFSNLIKMGGYISGQTFDPNMAANYNALFPNYAPFATAASDLSGFYQFNYANMGVYRSNEGWVATMRGMTSKLWGTEIYANANRFGRYQSYGALEVMYNATNILTASGYPETNTSGYDWNVVPGATVVRHSPNYWYSIQPYGGDRVDEYQKNDFTGSLSLGKSGVFAIDFAEDSGGWYGRRYNVTDNLKFKKTVFAHNDMLVCLGSNLSFAPGAGRSADVLATNLFQYIFSGTPSQPIYLNNATPITTNINSSISLFTQNYWAISPAGTGIFLPQQNNTLNLFKGSQSTPPHNVGSFDTESDYAASMITSTAAKGWLSHTIGNVSSYEYVVVPKTTPASMSTLSTTLGNGNGVYDILKQDSEAHVVRFIDDNTYGYAVFQATASLPAPLISTNNACLMMIQKTGSQCKVSLGSPDLNYQSNPVSTWISAPKTISVRLTGLWISPIDLPANVSISHDATTTIIEATVQDGFSTILTLNDTTTGVGNPIDSAVNCYASESKIHLSGIARNTAITVYNVLGQSISATKATAETSIIALNPGIYLVKAGSFCQKIYVK